MKILQIGKTYPLIGGVDKVIYELANGLSSKKIVCDVLCASTDKQSRVVENNEFSKFFVCGSLAFIASTWLSPKLILKLRSIIKNYDIIHIHHPDPMAALALLFASIDNKKIILHWHSDIVKQKFLLNLFMPLQNWLLSISNRVIVTTQTYADGSSHLKNHLHKVSVVPIGVEINFNDNIQLLSDLKNRYKNKKIIYTVGRLCYYKGFNYLIDAANYLSDDYVILIGGSGPLFADLNNLIITNNLQEKVILLGKIKDEDMSAYYQLCNLFCFPSIEKTEAFGIVQIEAMYYSKPIIATKIPHSGVSWVNKDGYSGINVEPKNAIELARAIKYICEDKAIENRLSTNAKKRFEEEFKLDLMIKRVLKIYNSVLIN